MEQKRIGVLFVCLGNICRSPTAEAVFVRDVEAAGLADRFEIDSAGTGDWHAGELAHPPTRAMAESRGVSITHRARQIRLLDFDRFDHVIVMDRSNLKNVRAIAKTEAHRAKVRLFRALSEDAEGEGAEHEVPDPYYSGEFGSVFDICEEASRALLAYLRKHHDL